MIERVRVEERTSENGLYFGPKSVQFLNSGCTLLNLAMTERGKDGGWPFGRVVNIVGDKSTGKTLLAEEALANFFLAYPKGKGYYRESEAAFDVSYAKALGLDTSKIDFGPEGEDSIWNTIEDVFEDLDRVLTGIEDGVAARVKKLREKNKRLTAREAQTQAQSETLPCLYIVDSLDALSSVSELGRDIREGSYNLGKQKMLGELFHALIRRIRQAKMCLIFISQTRVRIGPMIRGKQYRRVGEGALDFYSSIVLYLSEIGKLTRTVDKVQRIIGIRVKVKCDKNKIVSPHATCIFTIRFRYGIDDELSTFDYLEEIKKLSEAGYDKVPKDLTEVDAAKLCADVTRIWREIEQRFTPARGKYQDASTST
jgi:RecA/RadA recombinase